MNKTHFKALPFILFAIFTFGTGVILVTASQGNTEGRSKASGANAYAVLPPGAGCTIDGPQNPNSCNHCEFGVGGTAAAFEGQARTCGSEPKLAAGALCRISGSEDPISCNHCEYGVGGDSAAFEGQVRNCGTGTVLQQIGDGIESINAKLQQNGIGKGNNITCPDDQTLHQSPGGLAWCD